MPRPMMLASARGVLKQRAIPNSRWSPWVVPNTPPFPSTRAMMSSPASATSSPKTRMRSSAFICSNNTWRIASPMPDRLPGVRRRSSEPVGARLQLRLRDGGQCQHLIGHRGRVRPGGLQNLPADGGDEGTHAVSDLGGLSAGDHAALDQLALEADDRVVGRLFRELLGRPVLRLGVLGGVRVGPSHLRMDQAGPFARPHPRDRLAASSRDAK